MIGKSLRVCWVTGLAVVIFRLAIFDQSGTYLILVLAFSFDAFARMLVFRCPMMAWIYWH